MVYVYCPELFPTEVRGQGLSFATVMGSFGSLLAPIITDLMVRQTQNSNLHEKIYKHIFLL